MKKCLSVDVTPLVEAIEELSKEVKELKKALLTNQIGQTSKLPYGKTGPKQSGKYYNTKLKVESLKLGYVIQLTHNENSHKGKNITPPRILGRDWEDFPFVASGSLGIRFLDATEVVTTVNKTMDRTLINNKEERTAYLDKWYINTFNLIVDEVKKQAVDGKLNWKFKTYDLKNVIDLIEEKKIELNQL